MPTSYRRVLSHVPLTLLTAVILAFTIVAFSPAPSAEAKSRPAAGERIVKIAASKRGTPYAYGAAGPRAFDCSGYTRWVYARAGRQLPHSSAAQSTMGTKETRSSLVPGDLVFFGSPVHHVGIYVGNGEMVDAPNAGEDVRVEPLQSDFVWGRRISG